MTHDPLCQYDETRDSPCDWCDLIARVREDERGKWEANGPYFTSVVHECCERVQTERAAALYDATRVLKRLYTMNPLFAPGVIGSIGLTDAVHAIEALNENQA